MKDRLNPREQRLIVMLRLLLSYETGGSPPATMPRGLAVERARALIEEITEQVPS